MKRMRRVLELARQGLSDAEIHRQTGIHASVISRWKRQHPEFYLEYIAARVAHIYDAEASRLPHPE
jgi:transposase-like protein